MILESLVVLLKGSWNAVELILLDGWMGVCMYTHTHPYPQTTKTVTAKRGPCPSAQEYVSKIYIQSDKQ